MYYLFTRKLSQNIALHFMANLHWEYFNSTLDCFGRIRLKFRSIWCRKHVLFNKQSFVIFWVNWCKNECFLQRTNFTSTNCNQFTSQKVCVIIIEWWWIPIALCLLVHLSYYFDTFWPNTKWFDRTQFLCFNLKICMYLYVLGGYDVRNKSNIWLSIGLVRYFKIKF